MTAINRAKTESKEHKDVNQDKNVSKALKAINEEEKIKNRKYSKQLRAQRDKLLIQVRPRQ